MPTLRRTDLPVFHHQRVMAPAVHEIAERVAAALDGTEFDGPEVRLLIVRAAFASPHVRTERQAEEVAAGFEGRPSERCKGARRVRLCRLAGRRLQFLLGVLR
jgi:hypothetical protein